MRKLAAVIFCLVTANVSSAQTPLGLDEALQLARENNLQLKKQEQKQRIAQLEADIRRGMRLPSLDFTATTSYADEIAKIELPQQLTAGRQVGIELGGHDRSELAIGLRQPLFTGGRLATQVAIADQALESEEARMALLQEQTAYQVRLLFYQFQSFKKEYRILEASNARLAVQLQQARNLLQAAQIMAYDTLQIYNQALQIQLQMEQFAKDQRLVELQMARLLDLSETRPLAETELSRPDTTQLPVGTLKTTAQKNRPELHSVRVGQQMARLQKKLAGSGFWPEIGAEAKFHYAKPGLNQVTNEWMDYSTIGVSLQWNLWRGQQDRHRMQAAEAEYTRLSLEERELARSIFYEVERSWENVQYASRQIVQAERLVAQQRERYRIVSEQQLEGVASTNDVILAEADLTQAELQSQRALIQYHVSRTEMSLATGMAAQP